AVGATSPLSSTGGVGPTISLTGVVSITHGGTGLSAGPTAAGQYLRSTGANAWSVGSIQLGDLPNLAGTFWSLTGNTGTISTTNFLGTTDAQPLVIRTNNAEALRVDPSGNVLVGTAT